MLSAYKEDKSINMLIENFEKLKSIYNDLDRKNPKVYVLKSEIENIRESVI